MEIVACQDIPVYKSCLGGGLFSKIKKCKKKLMEQKIENLSDTKIFNVDQDHTPKFLRARGKISARKPPKNRFFEEPKSPPPLKYPKKCFYKNSKARDL